MAWDLRHHRLPLVDRPLPLQRRLDEFPCRPVSKADMKTMTATPMAIPVRDERGLHAPFAQEARRHDPFEGKPAVHHGLSLAATRGRSRESSSMSGVEPGTTRSPA
jgi:hypothetical protein